MDLDFESDDSFFDDPKLTKVAKTAEKKSLEDIFGFDEDRKPGKSDALDSATAPAKAKVRFNVEADQPAETKTTKTKTPDWLLETKSSAPKSSNPKSDPFDDVLSSVPSKSDSRKSFDLLDEILPQRGRKGEQSRTTSFDDILRDSKVQQRSGPGSLERQKAVESDPLESTKQTEVGKRNTPSDGLSMILEPPQGLRRGRRGSNPQVTDVLGLLGSGQSSNEFLGGISKASSVEGPKKDTGKVSDSIPDWLAGSAATINKSDTSILSTVKTEPEPPKIIPPEIRNQPVASPKTSNNLNDDEQLFRISKEPTDLSQNNFQTNMSNLQTQESFLLVSLQLKKYEENLTEIRNKQQEILHKQENQFDMFLSKYVEKQKGIEQEMLAQQERINEHIRMMTLSAFTGERNLNEQNNTNENTEQTNDNTTVLEKVVGNLKQRHNEEYFLMEESYKKQISLLEKSSEQVEQRLNQEIENTSKIYQEKLEKLNSQHNEEIKYWSEKIKSLETKHREELDSMKENHVRLMQEVKDEFMEQMERFKEQRNREQQLFASSDTLTQKLTTGIEKLSKNEEFLGIIQEKVVNDYNVLSIAREKSIENKEKEIHMMRANLEKCREQAEKDRSQLMALVRTLEQKLSEQNQNAQEERWALQQTAATLAARSAAFDREMEFNRASIQREREQIKTLKEALLAEQETITMHLTEEKLKLSAEKSRIEVSAKLVNNYEVEKIKTEAETAIKVAKELTEKLNLERNFVQRQRAELESLRNKLMEKECELLEREDTVEELRRNLQHKQNEDRRLIQETKFLENRCKEKLSELQAQAMSLSNREKKLAEEKLLVSKERLSLYTSIKSQSGHKNCMLCKAEGDQFSKTDIYASGQPGMDMDFIRLRMETLEDERNSEVSREETSPNVK